MFGHTYYYVYHLLYHWVIFVISIVYAYKLSINNNNLALIRKDNLPYAIILMVILTIVLGLRPVTGGFGDTANYARQFERMQYNPDWKMYELETDSNSQDKLFVYLMLLFARFTDVELFFLFVEFIYIGGTLFACKRLFPRNPFGAFLIAVGSFSFFAYGINGIRSGVSLSLVLVALSLLKGRFKNIIIPIGLCVVALFIHKSSILPSIMLLTSYFLIKKFNWALLFWIISIGISLLFGDTISAFFEGLGFDDRLDKYIKGAEDEDMMSEFSKTGFRWDFLLYSSVPIFIGYYFVNMRQLSSKTYTLILNTYILTNAFWVMIIRAAFSNRFAYLSWFLFPFALAYPFIKFYYDKGQYNKLGVLVLLNIIVTMILTKCF